MIRLLPGGVTLFLLCGFSFIAGFVDSVVGGGGLVQLPALLILLPGAPAAMILGTNKLASAAGTTMAARQYARRAGIDWHTVGPAAVTAFVFSFLGSRTAVHLNPGLMRPMILVLLIVAALYVFFVKDLGMVHQPRHGVARARWLGVATGLALGFYDGFFGPGTGSFLIVIFVTVFGFDFLAASASSKVINAGTNYASVLYFAATGNILYKTALPMAACNILGAMAGTRLAILKGSRFVRVFFLAVVTALIAKLGYGLMPG